MLYSVVKPCKHDTDWTVSARTFKLDTHTTYGKRKTPIDLQGQGSKVKVTHYTVLLNLVNMIQTEPFKLGPSNLVHILLMARGWHLLTFKVRGQTLLNCQLWCYFPLKFTRWAYFATLALLLYLIRCCSPSWYTTSFWYTIHYHVLHVPCNGSCVSQGGTTSYKKKLKSLYIFFQRNALMDIKNLDYWYLLCIYGPDTLKLWWFLYFINEKLNKNAKVEKLTKKLGRSVRLISQFTS